MIEGFDQINLLRDLEHELVTPETEWTTKDGRRVKIREMSDRHLLNTIRVLRNRSPIGTTFSCVDARRRQWVNAMANEAYRRELTIDDLAEGEPIHE